MSIQRCQETFCLQWNLVETYGMYSQQISFYVQNTHPHQKLPRPVSVLKVQELAWTAFIAAPSESKVSTCFSVASSSNIKFSIRRVLWFGSWWPATGWLFISWIAEITSDQETCSLLSGTVRKGLSSSSKTSSTRGISRSAILISRGFSSETTPSFRRHVEERGQCVVAWHVTFLLCKLET